MFSIALRAGTLYFTGVFALGFLFGAIRLMFLVPTLGELVAVLVELPVILSMAWLLCSRAITRLNVSATPLARLVMGESAFLLLMLAEFVLATFGFGETPASYVSHWATLPGAIGLAGQIVFGLFPFLQMLRKPV